MERTELIRQLDAVLTEWEKTQKWGGLYIEIKAGVPVMLKTTTDQKLGSFQNGGIPHVNRNEQR
jgi:hypothetical protein